jgi:hypothetical protein
MFLKHSPWNIVLEHNFLRVLIYFSLLKYRRIYEEWAKFLIIFLYRNVSSGKKGFLMNSEINIISFVIFMADRYANYLSIRMNKYLIISFLRLND